MIISASRRTDIPAAHAEWLFRRFEEGFVLTRNPMNPRRISRIDLSAENVDGIVFWTKNPIPMLERLDRLERYAYYFQYTLTAYGTETEKVLPDRETRLDAFLRLSDRLGPERVLWRYDPILISPAYPAEWHLASFERLAGRLRGATGQVTVSFVDVYPRNRKRLEALGCRETPEAELRSLAAGLAGIARGNGMRIVACSESIDLSDCGVGPARCVDAERLGRIAGVPLKSGRDPNQRSACGCAPSVDIGAYNTCPNGCEYCYANYSPALLSRNLAQRDDLSPLLCGRPGEGDTVSERKTPSLREIQTTMNFGGEET